ncbi:hypothetical protein ALC53_00651 [Atta colombica]|uniref:Uncharacterized protein n=1 Tax=Atta colombica TaxID=520822 RepID=A0A195BVQ8_9HYME|nr:hypothetical protein ALC53_00651 [Atta colombica]
MCDRKANSRLTTALQCYSMFDLRRYGYLVASLINRECIEISENASSDVVCAPRATCRDETASVNSRELQGFRQAEGSGRRDRDEAAKSPPSGPFIPEVTEKSMIHYCGYDWSPAGRYANHFARHHHIHSTSILTVADLLGHTPESNVESVVLP